MKCAREGENDAVAEAVVEQIADEFTEGNSSHSAAEPYQSRNGADDSLREEICRQNHDERGPGLLAEIGKTENHKHDGNPRVRNEKYGWHHRCAQAQSELARDAERK